MSAITLADLLATTAEPVQAAADAWRALADDLDRAADELSSGTRDLAHAWPSGAASEAASASVATLRAAVDAAYQPADRIAQALSYHASAVVDLRRQAEEVVGEATGQGFRINHTTGAVTVPAPPADGPVPTGPASGSASASASASADDPEAQRRAQGFTIVLTSIVARARGLDDATTDTLSRNLPDSARGFDTPGDAPAVTRDVLLAQRGRAPAVVAGWWRGLTPGQRERAVRDLPELVGWLDGAPATDRDAANRIRLERDRAVLDRRAEEIRRELDEATRRVRHGQLLDAGRLLELRHELSQVERSRDHLDLVGRKLADLAGDGLLLGIDPAGDGRAVIAVGNPDTARHTAVWVPGINTDLGDTAGNLKRVTNLRTAADAYTEAPDDVSAIMWLGYDTPENNLSILTWDRSRQGGRALDSFVDGLRASHDPGVPGTVTAVGHSYGSTVVAEAAMHGDGRSRGLAVDDIVVAGSPGMHTDRAVDLGLGAQHVWAGRAPDDRVADENPLTGWGAYGHGPGVAAPAFGANQYVTDTHGHGAYWDYRTTGAPTESLANQARIVVGQYDRVGLEHGRVPA